ncbi:LysR family transcriptional regulator [Pseudonocardia nematodicida]|uniref:LysR family transcriptional regulator n=1 Tax=Pseudonocardia nematodicida TaxID=1206997 RepID=A0ABV1KD43_9PSEU
MEARRLRYFVVLADELHFGRAAARLHIAQPALSQQIKALERRLGFALFDRDRRRVALTREGRALLPAAVQTSTQEQRLMVEAARIRDGEAGEVRVAFVGSALYGMLPDLLRHIRSAAPGLRLSVREMESDAQLEALRADDVDIGLVRPPLRHEPLDMLRLAEEELVAAVPYDHPLAGYEVIAPSSLADEPFVLFRPEIGTGFWTTVVQLCGEAGFAPRVEHYAEHVHTMIGMVASGLGITVVPASVRSLALAGVRYVGLSPTAARLGLAAVWDPTHGFPAKRRVIRMAGEVAGL